MSDTVLLMGLFRRAQHTLADDWEQTAAQVVDDWAALDVVERETLGELTEYLLNKKRWEAAQPLELRDDMCLTIALNAARLGLGVGSVVFDLVSTVIIHPHVIRRERSDGPIPGSVSTESHVIAGESHHGRGPILISWVDLKRDLRWPGDGRNVVIHEFAHKFDMLDGLFDGVTPLADASMRGDWQRTIAAQYSLAESDVTYPLRDYAITNIGEFFAVASEVFFTCPLTLRDDLPTMYELLRIAYQQDPAARLDTLALHQPEPYEAWPSSTSADQR